MSSEIFSNPAPPADKEENDYVSSKKLSNADFRTILNTPRPGKEEPSLNGSFAQPTKRIENDKRKIKKHKQHRKPELKSDKPNFTPTSKSYRDRAKERRDGKSSNAVESSPAPKSAGQYKAVSGDIRDNIAQAENRKQQIANSKFMGGDPNTTHLVKGLDYVLLEKTRNQAIFQAEKGRNADAKKGLDDVKLSQEDQFKSGMCKNIIQMLFEKPSTIRNQNFIPGKMAYRIDLEDDFAEFDVPTTIHRSIIEVGKIDDYNKTLSSNQNVISSLTNILSYLRGEKKQAKKAKVKEKIEDQIKDEDKEFDMFEELPETNDKNYREDRRKPHTERHISSHHTEKKHTDREKKSKYFETPVEEAVPHNRLEKSKLFIQKQEKQNIPNKEAYEKQLLSYLREKGATSGYDECYPELIESFDAMGGDSDNETDYTKMDMGNKKGPVGRWDFDNPDDYSKYMSNKEALPKAVFQYGVKMADGRKTRRIHGHKDDKAAIEKEWKQIQDIWKHKGPGQPPEKKPKS